MVVKILKVEDSNGEPVKDQVCLMNKSGSFSRICKSNPNIDALIARYGTPVYVNVSFEEENMISVKGLVRASF